MNDLLMSGDISERLSVSGLSGAIATFDFENEDKLIGRFISIEQDKKDLTISISVDEQDNPFKYFGLSSNRVIINSGSETLEYTGKFKILKIEKTSNYIINFGAKTYERTIWNESISDS